MIYLQPNVRKEEEEEKKKKEMIAFMF